METRILVVDRHSTLADLLSRSNQWVKWDPAIKFIRNTIQLQEGQAAEVVDSPDSAAVGGVDEEDKMDIKLVLRWIVAVVQILTSIHLAIPEGFALSNSTKKKIFGSDVCLQILIFCAIDLMYVCMKRRERRSALGGRRRVDVPATFSFLLILLAICHLTSSIVLTRGESGGMAVLFNDLAFLAAIVFILFVEGLTTYKEPAPTPTVEVQ
ncbi:hypothetical protein Taro_033715 [Colocasia esculenta]|uniref:Uncharacterized protein n=1 Tax=Colocasia esculenta TaxID=4460 RepID=A0A843VPF7_COLES|nr:hypothetical protein [Colocasia esculenta]